MLLYDLLQLYAEQGCRGSQLQFGTIRSCSSRRGERNPSSRDYERVRRDMDILRGYDFHCRNAFWDQRAAGLRGHEVAALRLGLLLQGGSLGDRGELPFGFIEVSPVLQQIARGRGFFPLGFGSELFYRLRPLEQRLAIYLAKKFVSQQVHRRFVEDLARRLPDRGGSAAGRPRRSSRRPRAACSTKKLPILRSFEVTGPRDGRWVAEFVRAAVPRATPRRRSSPAGRVLGELDELVDRMIAATGSGEDRLWWTHCAMRLGRGPVERAIGQLAEASRSAKKVRNRGALLTKILKDVAREGGIGLRSG